jgi:hypothetical protein
MADATLAADTNGSASAAPLASTDIIRIVRSGASYKGTMADVATYVAAGMAALAVSGASFNKVVITAPATNATLTIAEGKTLTASNTLTLAGTDGSTLNVGTGGTLGTAAYVADNTLAHLAGTETFSGAKTFTANPTISNVVPLLVMNETDADTDEKQWWILASAGQWQVQTRTDASGAGVTALAFTRTGTAVDEIELNATLFDLNGALDLSGAATLTGGFSAAAASSVSVAATALTLTNTTNSAAVTALVIQGDRATPTDNDNVRLDIRLSDSDGNQDVASSIRTSLLNVASGAENGYMEFGVVIGGTLAYRAVLSTTSWRPASTGSDVSLGDAGAQWADLFLASGGVINLNNGDVTITHSANALTFAGASSGYSFDGGITIGSPTGGNKGAGTLNAVAVYDDNNLLTDLVLDLAVAGSFDHETYKTHPIAAEVRSWWFDPAAYAEFWYAERHLPGMKSWRDEASRPSTGEVITRLTAVAETQAVHIFNHEQRIAHLEKLAA